MKTFENVCCVENSEKWLKSTQRQHTIYKRPNDIRSDFARDYNRILHSNGYRRLKTKTQVFFATHNDHICTRIEHVNHVASVSITIAKQLGLNEELVNAIAIGHDIGHAPFGHHGEIVIKTLMKRDLIDKIFWHEKNSLFFLDNIETLVDSNGYHRNLNLTYAVRDGVISHCGEVNEEAILPRKDKIELEDINKANEYQPFTWEGCVVKISDKIAYLGRDIEDAIFFKILKLEHYKELKTILNKHLPNSSIREINTGTLIHGFIIDLIENSSPIEGIRLSDKYLNLMNEIKSFNYRVIYKDWRIEEFKKYATVVIETLYRALKRFHSFKDSEQQKLLFKEQFPLLSNSFEEWLIKYSNYSPESRKKERFTNLIVYDINDYESYLKCCLDYISGMTDNYAIKAYNEIISF